MRFTIMKHFSILGIRRTVKVAALMLFAVTIMGTAVHALSYNVYSTFNCYANGFRDGHSYTVWSGSGPNAQGHAWTWLWFWANNTWQQKSSGYQNKSGTSNTADALAQYSGGAAGSYTETGKHKLFYYEGAGGWIINGEINSYGPVKTCS